MVRAIGKENKIVGTGLMIVKLACDSDDVKPVNGVATGSTCLEVDTGDLYIFSEDDKAWNFLKNVGSDGGGGGGDSDFSTAVVTFTGSTTYADIVAALILNQGELLLGTIGRRDAGAEADSVTLILYKGEAYAQIKAVDGYTMGNINITGDAEAMGENIFKITGNCNFEILSPPA